MIRNHAPGKACMCALRALTHLRHSRALLLCHVYNGMRIQLGQSYMWCMVVRG